jgi:ATP-binding cassette subfamily B protein
MLWLALKIVWRSNPRLLVAAIVLIVLQSFLPLVSFYLIKSIVDLLTMGNGVGDPRELIRLVGMLAIVNLANNTCGAIGIAINDTQIRCVTDYVYHLIHRQSILLDLTFCEDDRYYDTLHRAQSEAGTRPARILQLMLQFCQHSLTGLGIGSLLIPIHWSLSLFWLVAIILGLWARSTSARQIYQWQRDATAKERQSNYFHHLLTHADAAKELRLFGWGNTLTQRFDRLRRELRHQYWQIAWRGALRQLVTQGGTTLAMVAAYGGIAWQTMQGTISLGSLVLYFQALQRLQLVAQGWMASLAGLYSERLFLQNLADFLELPPQTNVETQRQPVAIPWQKGLVLEDVWFRYPDATEWTLAGIDLTIYPGELIALVGTNGSGKTSLIKLLSRLYEPTKGRILVDGVDIRSIDTDEWRRQLSIVFQDYTKYQLSARDNIWLGNIDESNDSEEILTAGRKSGIDECLMELPNGYETILGNWFNGGVELSIGQWQKMAIARAMFRKSQLVVLDEPTSALDPEAEAKIFQSFRQLFPDRAALLITHRLSSIQIVDRICVLQKGRIVELGTHTELIAKSGIYANLYQLQANSYQF